MPDSDPPCLYLVGTAGAGKSSLAGAYKEWILNRGLDAVVVNLDPGAESLPYTPDVDVRDWIDLRDLMRREGLGPNGAQIAAADLLVLNAKRVRDEVEKLKTQFVVFDTPGQIELFVFRQSGKYLVEFLYPQSSVLAFLLDPMIAREPTGFVSQLLLGTSVQFRLNLPTTHLLTKADLLTDEEVERIRAWSTDADALQEAFDQGTADLHRAMSVDLLRVLDGLGTLPTLHVTSAVNLDGLDDLYAHVQQVTAGGEDILKD